MGYLITLLKKDGKRASVKVSITHPDFDRINAKAYDSEEYCLQILVAAYQHKPDAQIDHPLKAKFDHWSTLALGERIKLSPAESLQWEGEKFYTERRKIDARIGDTTTGVTLCLEPEYRLFCFEAQDHISAVESSNAPDGDEVITFDVKFPEMLHHIEPGDTWPANVGRFWSMWVNVVHPRK